MTMFGIELATFLALCDKACTPLAYRLGLAARRGEWRDLVSTDVKPQSYSCPETYLLDAQIAGFFKKYPGFDLGIDRKAVAKDLFWDAERMCYRSNERISPLLHDKMHYGERIGTFVSVWKKKMRRALGRCPSQDEISAHARFGPGSTYMNRGDSITLVEKMSDGYTLTEQAKSFLPLWDITAWSRYAACGLETLTHADDLSALKEDLASHCSPVHAVRDFSSVRGNRFTTVPKDAKKDRGICVEASLNVFYQLAVGSIMTRRMRRSLGWDKSSAQVFHQNLARIGSLTGAIATIDLSSASDTVCSNLVQLLLPPDWYELVCSLRSRFTSLDGKWVKLEKFSSMGNGFTFELETVIFWTLCQTVSELEGFTEDPYTPGLTISVFGDDIIVPTSISSSVVSALRFFGFKPNEQKTFLKGPFRESCGGDFYRGHDVRPYHLENVLEQPHQLISHANGLRRFGHRLSHFGHVNAHRAAWFKCLDGLPSYIRRLRGPEVLGDLVIHDDEEHWVRSNPMRVRNGIRYLTTWRPVPNRAIGWEHYRPGAVLACALYGTPNGVPNRSPDGRHLVKGAGSTVPRVNGSYVSGYKIGRVAYS